MVWRHKALSSYSWQSHICDNTIEKKEELLILSRTPDASSWADSHMKSGKSAHTVALTVPGRLRRLHKWLVCSSFHNWSAHYGCLIHVLLTGSGNERGRTTVEACHMKRRVWKSHRTRIEIGLDVCVLGLRWVSVVHLTVNLLVARGWTIEKWITLHGFGDLLLSIDGRRSLGQRKIRRLTNSFRHKCWGCGHIVLEDRIRDLMTLIKAIIMWLSRRLPLFHRFAITGFFFCWPHMLLLNTFLVVHVVIVALMTPFAIVVILVRLMLILCCLSVVVVIMLVMIMGIFIGIGTIVIVSVLAVVFLVVIFPRVVIVWPIRPWILRLLLTVLSIIVIKCVFVRAHIIVPSSKRIMSAIIVCVILALLLVACSVVLQFSFSVTLIAIIIARSVLMSILKEAFLIILWPVLFLLCLLIKLRLLGLKIINWTFIFIRMLLRTKVSWLVSFVWTRDFLRLWLAFLTVNKVLMVCCEIILCFLSRYRHIIRSVLWVFSACLKIIFSWWRQVILILQLLRLNLLWGFRVDLVLPFFLFLFLLSALLICLFLIFSLKLLLFS